MQMNRESPKGLVTELRGRNGVTEMKVKHFLSGATLLSAALLLNAPLSAAVESDVVGYRQLEISNTGYMLLSLPFQELGEDASKGYPIQKIGGTLVQNDRENRAERLMVLDPITKQYTAYQYKDTGWVKSGENTPTTDVVPLGAAVFLKKASQAGGGEMVITGKVSDAAQTVVELSQGFNLVANPYPGTLKIADISGVNLSASDRENRADKIMILDPVTKAYTSYFLRSATGWTKEGESVTTTDSIAPEAGFFYKKASGNGQLTFTSPF